MLQAPGMGEHRVWGCVHDAIIHEQPHMFPLILAVGHKYVPHMKDTNSYVPSSVYLTRVLNAAFKAADAVTIPLLRTLVDEHIVGARVIAAHIPQTDQHSDGFRRAILQMELDEREEGKFRDDDFRGVLLRHARGAVALRHYRHHPDCLAFLTNNAGPLMKEQAAKRRHAAVRKWAREWSTPDGDFNGYAYGMVYMRPCTCKGCVRCSGEHLDTPPV
jgi:hypothetical protein